MNRLSSMTCLGGAALAILVANSASAQSVYEPSGQQLEFNLFQNFYTPPGASQATAAMYPAPHPVPYWVGGSHYTYQPYYPHQHLYAHKKNYYNYNGTADQYYSDNQRFGRGGDAMNKTSVIWKSTGYHFGEFPLSSYPAQKLVYAVQARKYGLRGSSGYGVGGWGGGVGGGGQYGGLGGNYNPGVCR